MSQTLVGKNAIVTGGSRGIGSAIALELASRGARVAITYVSESSQAKAQHVAQEIEKIHAKNGTKSEGPMAVVIRADASSMDAPKIIVSETLAGLKTDTVHILVNNAGISINQELGTITPDVYEQTMNIHVRGPLFLMQELKPHLPKLENGGGGRIVNISSISSNAGFKGQSVYAAAKAGIEGMTKVWATELGESHGATVNCINPGPVDTDMFSGTTEAFEKLCYERFPPAVGKRLGTPQDMADIVAFLCEEKSRWISGDKVCANGGGMYP
ncbi:hypothetical protein TRVA0_040S01200 [Trichomonascus vanleenenianus]|uniref:SDR family NAD(P)-dependent oxidoreductase n=1 Tax=Trichomonascus vanleenenianus TaxID=2268995 RepID=UPI003EC98F3F